MRSEQLQRRFISDFRRLIDYEAVLACELFDRRLMEFITAPCRTIRLRPDGDNFVPVCEATLQGRHSSIGSAHENQTHNERQESRIQESEFRIKTKAGFRLIPSGFWILAPEFCS